MRLLASGSSIVALSFLAALSGAPSASAQQGPAAAPAPAAPPVAEPPEAAGYREAIDNAIAEYEAGRFAESRALFEHAHTLFPNARALRGMGMAEFELRNYPASIYFLEQALASPVRPLQNELRAETEKLLARARAFVGRVKLEIEPHDAVVVLNGTRVQLGADHTLNLVVGDYTLHVSAPGYASESRPLRVAGGGEQTVAVRLPESAPVDLTPAPQPLAAKGDEGGSVFASPWLWAAVGVVVAGAAVGVGFAVAGSDGERIAPSGGSSGILLQSN